MAIWVDADACPNVIKEILFRAAAARADAAYAGGEPEYSRTTFPIYSRVAGSGRL